MKPNGSSSSLLTALQGLRISAPRAAAQSPCSPALPSILAGSSAAPRPSLVCARTARQTPLAPFARLFSATAARPGSWLEPSLDRTMRMRKGRPRVATGGSVKGTTVVWGDYGLRMWDHHRRISAQQLKVAEDTIKLRLRGQRYRLYKRVACNVGVFVSGNEMRMGKGKGSFDHWATRVAVNQIIFELRGAIHEAIVRDAFRLAGNKLPGQYEFVKKGDPAVVGITKLDGVTMEELKRPRKQLPEAEISQASALIASTPSTTTSSIGPSA